MRILHKNSLYIFLILFIQQLLSQDLHFSRWLLVECGRNCNKDEIIMPFLFSRILEVHMYTLVAKIYVPLITHECLWFMDDGAPPHLPLIVRDYLNLFFRMIGRACLIPWLFDSPVCTNSFWVYLH